VRVGARGRQDGAFRRWCRRTARFDELAATLERPPITAAMSWEMAAFLPLPRPRRIDHCAQTLHGSRRNLSAVATSCGVV
jgi:hypothetical protein